VTIEVVNEGSRSPARMGSAAGPARFSGNGEPRARITDEERSRLLGFVRKGGGTIVTWRRAQIVLLAEKGRSPSEIADVVFADVETVRAALRAFDENGLESLFPRYRGGRPPRVSADARRRIAEAAVTAPADLGLPFERWSLAKLADHVVATGIVSAISREGLRVSFSPRGSRSRTGRARGGR